VCHVSVGHVARAIEEAGTPTVVVMVRAFRHRAVEMRLPRTVITNHPMGRPMGPPRDVARQTEVLEGAFELLEAAEENGAIIDLDGSYRPVSAT
jgi:hypothetical protein